MITGTGETDVNNNFKILYRWRDGLFYLDNWTAADTSAGDGGFQATSAIDSGASYHIRIVDNGTNRLFKIGFDGDGANAQQRLSQANNNHVTLQRIGIALGRGGALRTTCTFLNWKVTNSAL